MVIQIGNIDAAGRLWFAWYSDNATYFSYLKYEKENMDILTADYQCEMEGNCRSSEAWQFFLFLKICYTQFLLCLREFFFPG